MSHTAFPSDRPIPKPAKRTFNPNRLTYIAKVRAAYEALQADGVRDPSGREVREHLKRGSFTDINGALKIIRGDLWYPHEPVVYQTRYTGEMTRPSTGTPPAEPVDDPTVERKG